MGSAQPAAAAISRNFAAGSGELKIAEPATNHVAPASAHSTTVFSLTPPSTWIATSSPSIARTRRTLSRCGAPPRESETQTLVPGLYKSTSSLEISSGDLTLDAQGDANAVFIFQMASTLTTTVGRKVILAGGAKAANIYWQVGSSATLGTNSVFKGPRAQTSKEGR